MATRSGNLIEYLRTPEAYSPSPRNVEEIQTHISWVFLADAYVYKVKKPVSLGFLDFSTLAMRKHSCEQEVRLNRRLCPDVYLGVVPISDRDGRFALDDDGNVVEYAVKMRKLAGGQFASELVETGRLETDDLDRVADALAAFYAEETPTPEAAAWGRTERLAISTDENFEQIAGFAGSLLSRAAFDAIRAFTNRFYDNHARLLNERRAEGRILDCHGDLHLEHVYLKPESVCIYDCIEFNERLRLIDVASDVAFLAMDLDYHHRPDLAVYFGEQMADRLADPELLDMLDFYKSYRAVVRGKVDGMRSRDAEVDDHEKGRSADRARAYFRLALRYAVAGSTPLVLVVMGRIATGKSTLAGGLADALGWAVVSSDRVRKEMYGIGPHERGTVEQRNALYASERTTATYEALAGLASDHVRRGAGVVLDATYARRSQRDELRETLKKAGAAYCFIELIASDETIRRRLRKRDEGEPTVSDARLEDFRMLSGQYEGPDDLEEAFHVRVASDESGPDALAASLQHLIRIDF